MAKTKITVRRIQVLTFVHSPGHRIGNKNIIKRRLRNAPYEIKKLLPEYKRADVKKMGKL